MEKIKKLVIRKDLNEVVVENIKFKKTKFRNGGSSVSLVVIPKLKGAPVVQAKCDSSLLEIRELLEQTGYDEPIKSMTLRDDIIKDDNGEDFVSTFIEVVMANGKDYRAYVKYLEKEKLNLIYAGLKKQAKQSK